MRWTLKGLPFFLLLSLSALPAAAGSFTLSLSGDSKVTVDSPSRLVFTVRNTDAAEGLSRIALRFPSGYRVLAGSPSPGWTAEPGPEAGGQSAEISFRASDEAKCTGAIVPGSALVFGVEVVAPASRSVTPDSLVSAQGEQSCRGVALDPPATLPSWDRVGIETSLAASPRIVGLGGVITATLTVTNISTVDLPDISALLSVGGTAGVSRVEGPAPSSTLALAPGASGNLTWTTRAASAGTLAVSGQAVSKGLTSTPVRSDTLYVSDLDVSLTVTPERVVSGREVRVQMTVKNRGAVRLMNVTPSPLTFDGTAGASEAAGPSPSIQASLEPGESVTFSWAATITGEAGGTYAFSGQGSAEWEGIVSANSMSNRGALAQQEGVAQSQGPAGSDTLGGGGVAGSSQSAGASGQDSGSTQSASPSGQDSGSTASTAGPGGSTAGSTASTGASAPLAVPSATLQLIGVNQDGRSTGGTNFSGGLLRYLRILVGWQNLSGTHTQRLRLFSPDGSLYQGFSTGVGSSSTETQLLVSGTWITEFSLFGAWRVEVFLDSQQMPTTSGVFVLTP